jgi:hypothetical protein
VCHVDDGEDDQDDEQNPQDHVVSRTARLCRMAKSDAVKAVGLRVPVELYVRLLERAQAERRSIANWVVIAVEEKLAAEPARTVTRKEQV